MALGAPAQAGCVGLSGTAEGFDKETAVSRAQLALAYYVKQYKAEKRLRAVTVSAVAATLLAHQRQREHVLPRHSVRHLQARHREREFLHRLLAWGGIALRLHLRCKGLLVVRREFSSVRKFAPIRSYPS
jgi:hypothetical protein